MKPHCDIDEQVVHTERTWLPPSETMTIIAVPNWLGKPCEGSIESGLADRRRRSRVCLAVRIGEIVHGGACNGSQILAAARDGVVESRPCELGQKIVFDRMEADRHAASRQRCNRVAFENSRGSEARGDITHPPPQIRILLACKHQFSSPVLGQM